MNADVVPVPVFPWPLSAERDTLLRRAKAALNIQLKIFPTPAVPGSPGRVLAFGAVPPWFAESVLVAPENVGNVASVSKALSFLLTAPPGTPGSFTGEMWLSAVMKCKVHFKGEEPWPPPPDTSVPPEFRRNRPVFQ